MSTKTNVNSENNVNVAVNDPKVEKFFFSTIQPVNFNIIKP